MGNIDIDHATASDMSNWTATTIDSMDTDSFGEKETTYMNTQFSQQWGYLNSHPDFKQAILMKARYNVGKGFTCKNTRNKVILSLITGFGKSTFEDLLLNMEVSRMACRDAYCEIIRDEKTGMLLNLKPISTGVMRHILDSKGMILRYEQVNKIPDGKTEVIKFKPEEIFHLSNDMLMDQSRGIAVSESLSATLIADIESFDDSVKIMHRQAKPFIIFKWRTDNEAKIAAMKTRIDRLRKLGEDLHLPDDDQVLSIEVVKGDPSQIILMWRNEIKSRLFRALGLPSVMFGAAGGTESGSKMEMFAHEAVWESEQSYIERQVKSQLGIEIDLIPPQSMAPALAQDTLKDGMAQQLDMQESDTTAGVGR